MCRNSPCFIDPVECFRSAARKLAGEVFPGEDARTKIIKPSNRSTSPAGSAKVSFSWTPPIKLSVSKQDDQLFRKVVHQSSLVPCTVCHRVLMSTHPTSVRGRAPEYVVTACGHPFHMQCLYSYLTETSETNYLECGECEEVRAWVRVIGWDAGEVSVGMDRLRHVEMKAGNGSNVRRNGEDEDGKVE
ncbi:hypothetical protein BKA63DRAFT_507607 [Paraphoma chrysanthemicola]|nr:hypothetical protein BKA63DRAFT_507607 [Paraphoma chrysanthemicola]